MDGGDEYGKGDQDLTGCVGTPTQHAAPASNVSEWPMVNVVTPLSD